MPRRRVPRPHLLVISDLHLGSDMRRACLQQAGDWLALCRRPGPDVQVARVLAGPLTDRKGRWRLILAGDVFDFAGMHLTPSDTGRRAPFMVSPDEEALGLQSRADRWGWLADRLCERHALFFETLAVFGARHDIVIVRGNHDAVLAVPEVRTALVRGLVAAAHRRGLEDPPGGWAARLRFEDWCYFEAGRIYIEHGHGHDALSADPVPHSLVPGHEREIDAPVTTHLMQRFVNHFPEIDLDEVEHWSIGRFMRWAFREQRPARVAGAFFRTLVIVIPLAFRQAQQQESWNRRFRHAPRVERWRGLLRPGRDDGVDRLATFEAWVRQQTRVRVRDVLSILFLDRLALFGGALAALAAWLTTPVPVWTRLAGALLAGGVVFQLDRWLVGRRPAPAAVRLRDVARRLAHALDVPLVVMGHTHVCHDERFTGGGRYVNLGSWIGAWRRRADDRLAVLVVRGRRARVRWWRPAGAPPPTM